MCCVTVVWDKETGYGLPNPHGSNIDTCNGTDPYADPNQMCKPTYKCDQKKAAPDDQPLLDAKAEAAVAFDYTCAELPPVKKGNELVPNPAGNSKTRCSQARFSLHNPLRTLHDH